MPACSVPSKGGRSWWRGSAARRATPSTCSWPRRRMPKAGRCALSRRLPGALPRHGGRAHGEARSRIRPGRGARDDRPRLEGPGGAGRRHPRRVRVLCRPHASPSADERRDAVLPPVWTSRSQDCEATGRVRTAADARLRQEHNRLLYVAMTRAADRLVVAPFRGKLKETDAAWCRMIRTGLETGLGEGEAMEFAYGPARLWRDDGKAGAAPPRPQEPAGGSGRTRLAPANGRARRLVGGAAPPVHHAGCRGRRAGAAAESGRRPRPSPRRSRPRPAAAPAAGGGLHPAEGRLRLPAITRPRPRGFPRFTESRRRPAAAGRSGPRAALHRRRAGGGQPVRPCQRRRRGAPRDGPRGPPRRHGGHRDPRRLQDGPRPRGRCAAAEAEASQIALYARLLARIYPTKRVVPMLVWTSGR